MRGEHGVKVTVDEGVEGSSPHARGAPLGAEDARLLGGIIPACAGSTRHLRRLDLACEDHPRMRGEHGSCLREAPRSPGSSPHARGAPRACRHTACQAGIIPACAGSTVRLRLRMLQQGDHPRMRGEHPDHGSHIPRPVGSSPHARGAQGAGAVRRAEVGIIPACAGSTLNRTINGIRGLGSSPLARGAPPGREVRGEDAGIIPACAGSTAGSAARRGARGDHPRLRGEHKVLEEKGVQRRGSSPLARGAHLNTCGFAQDSSESH